MLTIVGLPIGNIEDISFRSLKALIKADIVIAEDTRNYLKLRAVILEHFSHILPQLFQNRNSQEQEKQAEDKPKDFNPDNNTRYKRISSETSPDKFNWIIPKLISYREQNHNRVIKEILDNLSQNKNMILISDAGMPLISDPGSELINEVVKMGFDLDVIPGPTAIESSLVLANVPCHKFVFGGFAPRKPSHLKTLVRKYSDETLVLYESPFRIKKTLAILLKIQEEEKIFFNIAACNDLTKKFQKVYRGDLKHVIATLEPQVLKGEWVIVINVYQHNALV